MLEFIVVDSALVAPHKCVSCPNVKGQMLDTHTEILGYGRVYICSGCVKRGGIKLGLLKGVQMEKLLVAAEALAEKERDIEGAQQQIQELVESLAAKDTRIEQITLHNESLAGRLKSREHLVAMLKTTAEELVAS